MRELGERYSWVDDELDLAWTIAVVTGRCVTQVVAAYGATGGRSRIDRAGGSRRARRAL
jgi:hypothetical protein